MKITLTIDTDNDNFKTNGRALRDAFDAAATKLNYWGAKADGMKVMDRNGNSVGVIKVKT